MIFYTVMLREGDIITTQVESIDEIMELVKDDLNKLNISIVKMEFTNEEDEVTICEDEIAKLVGPTWDEICLKLFGVPSFLLKIDTPPVQQQYSNWIRSNKEREELVENLINEKVTELFLSS